MNNTIQCDIVSAQQEIFSGEVTMVVASGESGDLGIYPQHAPLMTALVPGPVRIQLPDGEESVFFVGGGILEVMPHLVTVLADIAIRAADADEAAAQHAREQAERELEHQSGEMRIDEAQAKLFKALSELQHLEQIRKRAKR